MKTYIEFFTEAAKIVGMVDLKKNTGGSSDKVSKQDLAAIEKILDKLFANVGIDIEFTKHFLERINTNRGEGTISTDEIRAVFTKTYNKYRKELSSAKIDWEAVLNDIQTDVNIPFVIKWDKKNQELDLVAKTAMKKKNFKTSNTKLSV